MSYNLLFWTGYSYHQFLIRDRSGVVPVVRLSQNFSCCDGPSQPLRLGVIAIMKQLRIPKEPLVFSSQMTVEEFDKASYIAAGIVTKPKKRKKIERALRILLEHHCFGITLLTRNPFLTKKERKKHEFCVEFFHFMERFAWNGGIVRALGVLCRHYTVQIYFPQVEERKARETAAQAQLS